MLACPAFGVVAVPPALSISQLVTSGQTVTLQAPPGDYYYQWTAMTGGYTIAAGTDQKFSFTVPQVSQEEGSRAVTISLFIRSKEGGCVNQTANDINVYPLPVCGISGPETAGPYDTSTYSYSGGTAGMLTFEWTVDGKKINDATAESVSIDWSQYDPGVHTVGVTLTKDYSDVAPGSTNPFRSTSCTMKTNITYTSGMEVTKQASPATASVGDAVTYTYNIRNTGTIGINSLSLKDDKLGEIDLESGTLMPEKAVTATATYVVKEGDLPGPLNNTVEASGKEDRTGKGVTATANASVALTYNAALTLIKVASSTQAGVGEDVAYTYTITNAGSVTIRDLTLIDDKLGEIALDKRSLAAGETTTAAVTYHVVEGDLPGPLTNNATVSGIDVQDRSVSASSSASVGLTYTSGLAVTKKPSTESASVGETVTYGYEVKNTGSVTINSLALIDDRLKDIKLNRTTLAAGETAAGSASYMVVEADLPGPIANTAKATGTNIRGEAVTAEAAATVNLTYAASLEVAKTPSSQTANVGEAVSYQYTVRNTGSIIINNIALSDDRLGTVDLNRTSLLPGESATGSNPTP